MRRLSLTTMMMTMLSSLWLVVVVVEGGLLEEKMNLQINDINIKADIKVPTCISTQNSGVIPCDTDPRCCVEGSPRVKDTNYCCPLGSYIYHIKPSKDDTLCACAMP
ncbi:hypothetical protein ACOMHN_007061 [Nucella lapillus]